MNEDKNEDSLSGEMSSSFSDLNSVEFQQNELIVNDGATCSFVNPTDIRDSSKSIEQVRKYSPNCMDSIEDQIPQNLIKRTISSTMLMKRKRGTTKQNSDESDWSSDVEEFAGFDVTCNGKSAFTPKRKIKEEPSTSDVDQISTNTTMENEKDVIKIEKEDSQEGDISNKVNEKVSQNESIKVRSESTRTSPNATAITSTTLMMDYNNDIKIIKKSPNLYDESEFTSVESTTTTTVPPSQLYATDDTETNIPTSSTTSLQITTATSTPTISTVTTPSSLITGKKLIDIQYLKPFEFGWKREFVLRANINDDKRIKGDKGEIYYIAPNGKRLRTKNYIHGYLHDGLELNNFTFSKEPLGVGPEHEIIRYAKPKPQQPVKRVPNFLDIGVPDPLFGFGKRIPKPKMPKGASPPPPSVQSPRISTSPAIMNTIKSRMLSASARKSDITISENESKSVPQKTTKGTINKNKPPINTHVKQLTTGDDLPSFKKRLLARNSKLVSSASSSPDRSSSLMSNANNLPGTPKSAIIDNKNKRQFGTNSGNNAGQVNNSTFASNFFSNVSLGYDVLLHICQYLKVQELLRASCVCRVWNQVAHYSSLWRTVRMKNSQVNDWAGLANTLKRNGTKHLDLRKMLLPSNPDAMWLNFSANIGTLDDLQTIELCRCPASVVEELFLTNPNLKCLNALAIRDTELNINNLSNLSQLTELRLKCSTLLEIENLLPLRELVNLKHLSLTSVNELGLKYIDVLGYLVNLETLELGQCGEFTSSFASDTLINLQKLTRLRLERGQDQCCTFNILDTVSRLNNLVQLELVNFDIKSGFDVRLEQCINLRRLLLIPTYISQSATTNHMILSGVMKLAQYLESFTWVVTLELLRVTELYVDQCDDKKGDFIKSPGESIPVLKPVPGISDNNRNNERTITDVPQVEILSLETVEKIIMEKMPQLNFQILKVAQHATWRQNIVD